MPWHWEGLKGSLFFWQCLLNPQPGLWHTCSCRLLCLCPQERAAVARRQLQDRGRRVQQDPQLRVPQPAVITVWHLRLLVSCRALLCAFVCLLVVHSSCSGLLAQSTQGLRLGPCIVCTNGRARQLAVASSCALLACCLSASRACHLSASHQAWVLFGAVRPRCCWGSKPQRRQTSTGGDCPLFCPCLQVCLQFCWLWGVVCLARSSTAATLLGCSSRSAAEE